MIYLSYSQRERISLDQNRSPTAQEERLPNLIFVIERVIETIDEPQRPLAVLAILKGESAQNLLNPNLRHGFPAIVAFLAQRRPPTLFHRFTAHNEF